MHKCFGEVLKNVEVAKKVYLELLEREAIIQSYRQDC